MSAPGDHQGTAERGRRLVAARLRELGAASIQEDRIGRRPFLRVTDATGRRIAVFVKTKTGGDWQADTRDTDPERVPRGMETFWVLVDLDGPHFFIAEDEWMRDDIRDAHAAYLESHGGTRAHSPNSTHHAIRPARVREWRSRWDLLRLGGA